MFLLHRSLAPALLLLSALVAAPAQAQLFKDTDARKAIEELKTQFESTREGLATTSKSQIQLAESVAQLRKAITDLSGELAKVREDLTALRSSRDGLAKDVALLQKGQADHLIALDARLLRLEPQKVKLEGPEFQAEPQEQRLYDEAMAQFKRGNFEGASLALSAFLQRYPASGYENLARFWYGNALFARADYRGAMAVLRTFVSTAPEHARAPSALLAISSCQVELKTLPAARKTIDELMKAYPDSEAAAQGKERLALLR